MINPHEVKCKQCDKNSIVLYDGCVDESDTSSRNQFSENDVLHVHNNAIISHYFSCIRGHRFYIREEENCPSCSFGSVSEQIML